MPTKPKTVEVVVYRVGKPAVVEAIPDTLEAQQAIVGGDIKDCILDHLTVIYGAEAADTGQPPNRQVGRIFVLGNFFICRTDEEGCTAPLTKKDRAFLKKNYAL